ncbi:MAG: PAS domain-containing protein [Anaerolinea sp.]|nr:PAS domain-containing protein [Anaerolinea sp.]
MDTAHTSQVLVLLASTAIATLLTLHAWQRRPAVGSVSFALLMMAVSLWSLAYLLEITLPTFAGKLFWVKLRFLGMVIVPVVWLLFVWEYTGNEKWLTRRKITAVALTPAITLLLTFTNDTHNLVWSTPDASMARPFMALALEYGLWFWVHTAVAYTYLLVGSALLMVHWRQQQTPLYRRQVAALLIGLLLPWVGNVLHVIGVSLLDLTPFAFAITGILMVRYALRFRLFDINPVAYRVVVNSMEEGVVVLDRKGRIVEANPAARAIMRIPTNPIGRTLLTVWPDLEQMLNGAPEKSIELPAPHNDTCYYEVTISPLYDWRQALQGRLLIIRDITERRAREQLRNDMTRSMVHDLRVPISNTLFALQMLKGDLDEVVSADNSLLLEMTFANTEKTLQLVNQILDVHRLESGKLPVAFAHVRLAELVQRVFAVQQSRAAEKQLQLTAVLPDDLPPAWADAGLLERVLQNLVDNAIKFSPVGRRITVLAAYETTTAVPKLLVTVQDEGPGIPLALRQTIFEKYVTGEQGETGSGLGLSFCQMALAAHGEQIWVEPTADGGAAFVFSLTAVPT